MAENSSKVFKNPSIIKGKDSIQESFLELILCPPKYISNKIKNNAWMNREGGGPIDQNKAMAEFFSMYGLFSQDALVYLLPPKKGLQDQVYITNAGVSLPHAGKEIILSNFTAPGRPGEEKELAKFLEFTEYKVARCPFKFEGEAELKWIRENIYIGGYGERSDIRALSWIERFSGAKIIKMHEPDQLRYHLDCSVFPISGSKVILATDNLDVNIKKEIESVAEIISVSKKDSQWSITNSVRIGSIVYNGTDISELKKTDENYPFEKHKNEELEKICSKVALSPVFVNLSEFSKSGAALSCCVFHLNRIAYPD